MAKEQLTREMVKNHLKKQLKNALPKTFITLIPIAFLIWFQIFSFEIFYKVIDDYLNPFAAMCIWFFIAIAPFVYPMYIYIASVVFQIKGWNKLRKNDFTITEDEIDYIRETELINFRLRFRFKLLLGSNIWHGYYDVIYLKDSGRYIVLGPEDGIVRMSSSGDKVYVVHYNGMNEPLLIYNSMIYEYSER